MHHITFYRFGFVICDEQENWNQVQHGTDTMKLWCREILNLHIIMACALKNNGKTKVDIKKQS